MEEKIARLKEELREVLEKFSRNPAAEDGERAVEDGMTAEREARILEGAIAKWGPELQTDVAIEEMAELIQAITKYRRALAGSEWYDQALEPVRQHIREEMADVSIMLRQLELIYGGYADEEIQKLERLEALVFGDGLPRRSAPRNDSEEGRLGGAPVTSGTFVGVAGRDF